MIRLWRTDWLECRLTRKKHRLTNWAHMVVMKLTNRLLAFTALFSLSAFAQNNFNAASYPGADASLKINACIAAVISSCGGVCDPPRLGGEQKMSQEIHLGSAQSVQHRMASRCSSRIRR